MMRYVALKVDVRLIDGAPPRVGEAVIEAFEAWERKGFNDRKRGKIVAVIPTQMFGMAQTETSDVDVIIETED